MTQEFKEYLWIEWRNNNQSKYYNYFSIWLDNLTETQILYYKNLWFKKDINNIIKHFIK